MNFRGHAPYAFTLLSLVVLLAACGPPSDQEVEVLTKVTVEVVSETEISRTAYAGARVEGLEEAMIYALTPGKVEEVLVSEGDSVVAGQRLVRLNTDQQASAGAASALAGVSAARANLDNASSNYERLQALFEAGGVSLQAVEGAQAAYQAAQAALSQANAGYSQARTSQENSWITAPFSGEVGRIWARVGNSSSGTPLISITNNSAIVARVLLPEEDLLDLEPGLPAYITVAALDNISFPGIVTAASSTVDQMSGLVPVEVRFDDTGGQLRPGMAGRVAVLTETFADAIAVSERTLRRTQTGYQVAVLEDARVVLRDVETGISSDGLVQIVSGLRTGDSLIVAGQTMVQDGDRVEVVSR